MVASENFMRPIYKHEPPLGTPAHDQWERNVKIDEQMTSGGSEGVFVAQESERSAVEYGFGGLAVIWITAGAAWWIVRGLKRPERRNRLR